MTVEDKTKEQLKKEVSALQQKLTQYEEAEARLQAALSIMVKAYDELQEHDSAAELGSWKWDSLSRTATFDGWFQEPESPLFEKMESHFAGSWEEIIDPEDLEDVVEAVESWNERPRTGSIFWFRFKEEPQPKRWMMAIFTTHMTVDSKDQTWVRGIYWDASVWKAMIGTAAELTDHVLSQAAVVGFCMAMRPLIRSASRMFEFVDAVAVVAYHFFFCSLLIDSNDVPFFEKKVTGEYVSANRAVADYFGVPVSDIIGKKDDELFEEEKYLAIEFPDWVKSSDSLVVKTVKLKGKSLELCLGMEMIPGSSSIPSVFLGTVIPPFDQSLSDIPSEYKSLAMRKTMHEIVSTAKTESTILMTGESGSGKDFLAKHIHDHSDRSAGPFKSINCPSVSPELAESELFGHERGAFTGAKDLKRGLLELAEGGTLFLNEIGDLPLSLQAKLLTFLDTRKFTRVGGQKDITVNARIIAATNKNLEEEVKAGRFREDLLFRLNVIQIRIPPLRDRREDTPVLARQLLAQLQEELKLAEPRRLSARDLQTIMRYSWPGNVRELRNVLERSIILSVGPRLEIHRHLSQTGTLSQFTETQSERSGSQWTWNVRFPREKKLEDLAKDMKRALVDEALRRTKGNKSRAALLLGIDRHTLADIMTKR